MEFIIVEIGSTNTKAFINKGEDLESLGFVTIEFKDNFKKENKIADSDKEKLFNYIAELKKKCTNIYVYGTSVFRNLDDEAKKLWLEEFRNRTGYDFTIVSSEKENRYTTYGAFDKSYKGSIAIMIGGGASTELAIFDNGELVEEQFYNFGVTSATDKFPDIRSDKVQSDYKDMLEYMKSLIDNPAEHKADVLVLAGGDHIYFAEGAKYPIQKNKFYDNKLHPYYMEIADCDKEDQKFFYETSLDEICHRTNKESWWRGVRGMRLCVKILCDMLDVKYVIPTSINMIYGIAEEIKNENRDRS